MAHQALPHGLVALPLLEGVAGPVPVLIEGEGAAGEFGFHKILDDGFLVLNGHVVPVQLVIHRNTAVARDIKAFYQYLHHTSSYLQIILYIKL